MKGKPKYFVLKLLFICIVAALAGCSTPLSTREKAAGIGALGGAAAGGIIGSAVGHPGAGAAIGGALGLGTGALIGDQLQGQEQKQQEQQRQIEQNQAELERQRRELETLKEHKEYRNFCRRFCCRDDPSGTWSRLRIPAPWIDPVVAEEVVPRTFRP